MMQVRRPTNAGAGVAPAEKIAPEIFTIRGERVMLSIHLAPLYGVQVRALMQAVRRNRRRFPSDFMFQLTWDEIANLDRYALRASTTQLASRSQSVILKRGENVKYLPYAFTEQGVAMLSSVLRSKRAVTVNVAIMRAFVRLRELMNSNKELARKLDDLEKKYDGQFRVVFDAIRRLMQPPIITRRRIGF